MLSMISMGHVEHGLDQWTVVTPPVIGQAHTENEPIITINATDQQNIERQQLVSMARCVKYTGGV